MKAVMYGSKEHGALVEMRETLFDKEVDLQEFLTNHQGLLAGDQMNPAEPRRFLLVTAEAGIAIAEGGSDYFSLDHLFIDQDGIPTLVEVKRSTDTRLRREVIGQMLEYAANACAFWTSERLKHVFERRCEKASLDATEELQVLRNGGDVSPDEVWADEVWARVSSNLRQQRLRLVFVADKFSPETQRIIEFLNRQMQLTEVFAVEVRQFAGDGMKTLVPRVLNPSLLQTDRRVGTSGVGETWTPDRFYNDLRERHGDEAVTVFRQIDAWVQEQSKLSKLFGRGKLDGSMQITHKYGPDASTYEAGDTVIVTLWTYGTVEIEFQYMANRPALKAVDRREALRAQLMNNSTLEIPLDKISKRPNIQWSEFTETKNLNALFASITWILEKFAETRSEDAYDVSGRDV